MQHPYCQHTNGLPSFAMLSLRATFTSLALTLAMAVNIKASLNPTVNHPIANGITLNMYDLDDYDGTSQRYILAGNQLKGKCYTIRSYFNNRMSSYTIVNGYCTFFDDPTCKSLLFSSKSYGNKRPNLPTTFNNRVSSFSCFL